MSKYYIGIDIALRKTGIVTINDANIIVQHSTFIVPPRYVKNEAIGIIFEHFQKLSLPEDCNEAIFVVEDVLARVHLRTALSIEAARTACILGILSNTHPSNKHIYYYTPNAVKYHFARKRGAKKDELLAALRIAHPEYDYTSLTEDEIDALALGLLHREKPTEKEKNVSKKKPVRKSKSG